MNNTGRGVEGQASRRSQGVGVNEGQESRRSEEGGVDEWMSKCRRGIEGQGQNRGGGAEEEWRCRGRGGG